MFQDLRRKKKQNCSKERIIEKAESGFSFGGKNSLRKTRYNKIKYNSNYKELLISGLEGLEY